MAGPTVIHAVASRAHPNEEINGDGVHVSRFGHCWRLAVIDGLGHGPDAAHATSAIAHALDSFQMHDLQDTLLECHTAARGTRGAAVSIAMINLQERSLVFGGLGNVEGRLIQTGRVSRLVPARGIAGVAMRRVHQDTFALEPRWLLLLHSDGISARLALEWDVAGDPSKEVLQHLADSLLVSWARDTDDATILIAGSSGLEGRTPGP